MTTLSPVLDKLRSPRLLWAGLGAASMLALGYLLVDHARIGLILSAAVLVAGLTAFNPMALPLLAFPTMIIVERVGGGGVDLSASDFMLFAALWPALLFAKRPFSKPMRTILWLSGLYQALTLFTVVLNPYTSNVVEWFHAWLLVSGALIVGWAVGRSGYASLAVSLLMFTFLGLAVLTLAQAVLQFPSVGFQPVYLSFPYYMHKNFIGCTLAFGAVIAYAKPLWLRWPSKWLNVAFVLCAAGVGVSQARQAIVSVAVAIVIIALRPDPDRKRSRWVVSLAFPALLFVFMVFQDQLQSDNTFNSTYQRFTWYQRSVEIWQTQPWTGVGLRWWYTGRFGEAFQPPNAELEVLTSTGVIGLLGFIILFVGILVVLWRINPRYGTLAFVMVLTRVVQGQFDLFWIAVHVPIPLLIAGVCLGVMARKQAHSQPVPPAASAPPDPAVSQTALATRSNRARTR